MTDFTQIAKKYEKDSIIQRSASEVLFDMLDIGPDDSVLDLGCGTGHITRLINTMTNGKVVGVDPSDGMIQQACEKQPGLDITYRICRADELGYENTFDVIFCNSVFQWFTDPLPALISCYQALSDNGRMAIQAPARENYCPNFITAVEEVKKDRRTRDIFEKFTTPWLFFNSAKEYSDLFEKAGFTVEESLIDEVVTEHTPGEVNTIFASGAAAGYLNQKFYKTRLTEDYIKSFKDIVRDSFVNQADNDGKVILTFYRIYLLAVKPR